MIFYGDKGKFGATGVHSIHKNIPPIRVPKAEWDAMRVGMLCTAGDNVAYVLLTIDRLCVRSPKTCKYDEMTAMITALRRMRSATNISRPLRFYVNVDERLAGERWPLDPREVEAAHTLGSEHEVFDYPDYPETPL